MEIVCSASGFCPEYPCQTILWGGKCAMNRTLVEILKEKVVIVGLGQVLKGDDGLGSLLIERLQGRVRAVCLDAGTAPENYLGKILQEQPQTILFVDAVDLARPPGDWEILSQEEILSSGLTTHDLSPRHLLEYLREQTSAGIFLLGVQPQHMGLGAGLSMAVNQTLEDLVKIFAEILHA
jgi:hydrogenase 3 maturation protease